jgi:hypothetical protein
MVRFIGVKYRIFKLCPNIAHVAEIAEKSIIADEAITNSVNLA